MQAEATIYFGVRWVLFEYSSFDHFPKCQAKAPKIIKDDELSVVILKFVHLIVKYAYSNIF